MICGIDYWRIQIEIREVLNLADLIRYPCSKVDWNQRIIDK